jgi:hypothetical protein
MSSSHRGLPPLGPPRVEEVSDGVYAYVQPRGGAIDVRAALADMVTYNGGRPLSCRA